MEGWRGWRDEGLLYRTGGVGGGGEQCDNVTLPHSSPSHITHRAV